MEIVQDKENINELIRSLPKNKKVGRFSFLGNTLHEGHKLILDYIKSDTDIVIANYVGHADYLLRRIRGELKDNILKNPNYNIEILKDSFKDINIDYLVISKIEDRENNFKIVDHHLIDYRFILEECKRLNISRSVTSEVLGINLENPLEFCTEFYYGIKNLYIAIIASKFYKRQIELRKPFLKEYHLFPKFIKDKNGDVLNRTKFNITLNRARSNIIEEIKNGKIKSIELEKRMYDYYIEEPMFTILDIKTIEKIQEINDHCLILLMSKMCTESIFILNGNLVY